MSWSGGVDWDCYVGGGVVCGARSHAEQIFVCHCSTDENGFSQTGDTVVAGSKE